MYEKVNGVGITENHLRALALFTKGYDKEYYIREINRLLGVSPRTAQLVLADLEKKMAIESHPRGKIRLYKLRRTIMARSYACLAEEYKRLVLLKDDEELREVVENIMPSINGIGAVFGAYAKEGQKTEADLDIFVAGEYDDKKVSEIARAYGININVEKRALDVFAKDARVDPVTKQVVESHVIIRDVEAFVDAVLWD